MKRKRCFYFHKIFISCDYCSKNYNASNPKEKTFCQEFSFPIDPNSPTKNNERGLDCKYWVPDGIRRDLIREIAPERERWYEKD